VRGEARESAIEALFAKFVEVDREELTYQGVGTFEEDGEIVVGEATEQGGGAVAFFYEEGEGALEVLLREA